MQPEDRAVIDLQLSIYSQQGQWDKIRLMLQRRELSLNPASAAGLTYAEALLRLDRPEHARAILSKALIAEPGNRYARMMLGEAQLATGDARSALATLRPLVEGVFVYPREFELAERAAIAAGDPLSAVLSARRKSGELSRRSTLIEQGFAATARSNWPSARAAWQQLQRLGDDAELLRRIADCASLSGAHTLAITSADKAAALQPEDAELLHLAGAGVSPPAWIRCERERCWKQRSNWPLPTRSVSPFPHRRLAIGDYAPGECLAFGRHFLSVGDGRDGGGGNRAGALCGFSGAAAIEDVGLVLVKRPNQ